MAIGNRIFLQRTMVKKEVLTAFSNIPAANIADSIGRLCALHPRIKLMSAPQNAVNVGRALTVKSRAGDNLMIHKAIDIAEEGDVIIVSNDAGESYRSVMGEIMFCLAGRKKISGIIVDGPIRDMDAVRKMQIPIYAVSSNPGGPYKDGTGEINVPISCGGISISAGDVVVMDSDGVVIIPHQEAEEVLQLALKFQANDEKKVKAAVEGSADREWVNKKLQEHGTEIIDRIY